MKQMKGKFFAALLVCVLAALWAVPANAYPKWVGIKGRPWAVVRNEKQKDPNANDYKLLRMPVTYTNNSKDKIITAIFNKTISFSCKFGIDVVTQAYNSTTKWSTVNKLELYPGQSHTLNYYHIVNRSNWDAGPRKWFNTDQVVIRDIKWNHDFNVSTQTISVE